MMFNLKFTNTIFLEINHKNDISISTSISDHSSRIDPNVQKRKKYPNTSTILSANLQSFVNRLSTPKKKENQISQNGQESLSASMSVTSNNRRSSTPQPLQTSIMTGDQVIERLCENNSNSVNPNCIASSGISSAGSSAISIIKKVNKRSTLTTENKEKINKERNDRQMSKAFPRDQKSEIKKDPNLEYSKPFQRKQELSKIKINACSQTKQTRTIPQSVSMNTIGKLANMKNKEQKLNAANSQSASNLTNLDSLFVSNYSNDSPKNVETTKNQNQTILNQPTHKSYGDVDNSSDNSSEKNDEANINANMATNIKSNKSEEEEAYKRRLEEKRKEARERAAREEEAERLETERRRKEEEEAEQRAAEEEERLNQIARELEQKRMREAIALNERIESEKRMREDAERKAVNMVNLFIFANILFAFFSHIFEIKNSFLKKEEAEKKAREESDRLERERLEKLRKDEEERLERKKVNFLNNF